MSRYFAQSRHAAIVKRKRTDEIILVPGKSRQATHDIAKANPGDFSTDVSEDNDDSWYYSEDGKVSQTYWDFATRHSQHTTKTYFPDNSKCDHCFQGNRIYDITLNGILCPICVHKKATCVPQSRETRRLVLPKNHGKSKLIANPKSEPPCQVCFQADQPCHLEPGTL